MLVGLDRVLRDAQEGSYAVGAFNITNMETTQAVLEAAVEKNSPVILAFAEPVMKILPMEPTVAMMRDLAVNLPIPVVIHLDHGRTFEGFVRAIRSGATSLMFDGSVMPFEENVARTQELVRIAHAVGLPVEAEIGRVGQGADYVNIVSDRERFFTRPSQAVEFVERTGVDALAVAVGTAHGVYVGGTPRIEFDRLSSIREATRVPLVLHGGSSTRDQNLARAVACGITKVNIATDMSLAAKARIKQALAADEGKMSLRDLLSEAKAAFRDVAAHYMDVFGSTGKARC